MLSIRIRIVSIVTDMEHRRKVESRGARGFMRSNGKFESLHSRIFGISYSFVMS